MTNNVIAIRSYSHREMIDIASLMFANGESDLIELQIRMPYTARILKPMQWISSTQIVDKQLR